MNIRFITADIHALLDYPVAAALLGLPFLLGLGDSHPAALWLSVTAGAAALLLTILTDHKLGFLRVIPYPAHVAVDGLVGAAFLVAPFAIGFTGLDFAYYLANGAAVATVVSLNKPAGKPAPSYAAA